MRPTDVPDQGLLCDLLWSDPDKDVQGWGENDRGVSFTFGAEVVAKFLHKHDLDLICRAHQVPPGGHLSPQWILGTGVRFLPLVFAPRGQYLLLGLPGGVPGKVFTPRGECLTLWLFWVLVATVLAGPLGVFAPGVGIFAPGG